VNAIFSARKLRSLAVNVSVFVALLTFGVASASAAGWYEAENYGFSGYISKFIIPDAKASGGEALRFVHSNESDYTWSPTGGAITGKSDLWIYASSTSCVGYANAQIYVWAWSGTAYVSKVANVNISIASPTYTWFHIANVSLTKGQPVVFFTRFTNDKYVSSSCDRNLSVDGYYLS